MVQAESLKDKEKIASAVAGVRNIQVQLIMSTVPYRSNRTAFNYQYMADTPDVWIDSDSSQLLDCCENFVFHHVPLGASPADPERKYRDKDYPDKSPYRQCRARQLE